MVSKCSKFVIFSADDKARKTDINHFEKAMHAIESILWLQIDKQQNYSTKNVFAFGTEKLI